MVGRVEPDPCPADPGCKEIILVWYAYVGERPSGWPQVGGAYCCVGVSEYVVALLRWMGLEQVWFGLPYHSHMV